MDISVIIPTYKPDEYFYECLNSFTKQTFSVERFEVLVILNGAKEPYEEDILKYISKCNLHIRYFYLEEAGVSAARNKGLKEAFGKYIAYVDSDDWVSENYLEKLFSTAELNEGFSVSNVILCDSITKNHIPNKYIDRLAKNLCEDIKYSHKILHKYFSFPWAKLMPAETCRKALFNTRFSYGEDSLYMFEIEPYLKKGGIASNSALYFKREVIGSLSTKNRSFYENAKIHLSLIKAYWKLFFFYPKKYSAIFFIRRNIALTIHILRGK